jgi:hypothetical protein
MNQALDGHRVSNAGTELGVPMVVNWVICSPLWVVYFGTKLVLVSNWVLSVGKLGCELCL